MKNNMLKTVGCVLILEGKSQFFSHLALVLVSYWIGDERLSSIYTNSSQAYCHEWLSLITLPHACIHAEPKRVVRAHDVAGANAVRLRGS